MVAVCNFSQFGVIFSHGRYWKDQKTLRHLRDFDFGKISDEISKLILHFKRKLNQPVQLNSMMNISIINAALHKVHHREGEKFDLENPKFEKITNLILKYEQSEPTFHNFTILR